MIKLVGSNATIQEVLIKHSQKNEGEEFFFTAIPSVIGPLIDDLVDLIGVNNLGEIDDMGLMIEPILDCINNQMELTEYDYWGTLC